MPETPEEFLRRKMREDRYRERRETGSSSGRADETPEEFMKRKMREDRYRERRETGSSREDRYRERGSGSSERERSGWWRFVLAVVGIVLGVIALLYLIGFLTQLLVRAGF